MTQDPFLLSRNYRSDMRLHLPIYPSNLLPHHILPLSRNRPIRMRYPGLPLGPLVFLLLGQPYPRLFFLEEQRNACYE